MKRAVITGATGAIGTALVNSLINSGIEVLVLLRKGSSRNDVIPNSKLITKKFCSLNELVNFNLNTKKKYDVFYHFAWEGTTGEARDDLYLQNQNVKYTLDAISLAKRLGCNTFIGAGSQAEYGRVNGNLTPTTKTVPENGYGIAKLTAGLMAKIACQKEGLKCIWVRVLSVYGPNDNKKSMIASTLEKLINNQNAQFTKGEQMWDYLFSSDAAEAFKLLGDFGIDGKTYVLGSGKARKLKDYILDMKSAAKSKSNLEFGAIPYAEKQVMHLCADVSELTKDTGWTAKTKFKDGISTILNELKR